MLELPGAAARRRRRRDERLDALRGFAAGSGWSVQAAAPGLLTRHPLPDLLAAERTATELVVAGSWSGRDAVVASVVSRPAAARLPRGHRPDEVRLLVCLEVPPVHGRFSAFVTGRQVHTDTSATELVRGTGPRLEAAVGDGVLREGDYVALGELSVAVLGGWRPALASPGALRSWLDLLDGVAGDLLTA